MFLTGQSGNATLPELTPQHEFYTQQIRSVRQINADYWSIVLDGLVERPVALTYPELMRAPSTTLTSAVVCAGDRRMIGQAVWRGVLLHDLISQAGRASDARYAHFFAADGYTTSLRLDQLDQALIAYQINGEPLSPAHGYPARLIVPGLYGYKQPKWIQRIALSSDPLTGFWEGRGWSDTGEVQPAAWLTDHTIMNGQVQLSGMAYAGAKTLTRIDLRVDGGDWMPIDFTPPQRYCWTRWNATWTPSAPGRYMINARAWGDDEAQPDKNLDAIVVVI